MKVEIIAEIGLNHNGSVELGRRLIEAVKRTGADYVKFQLRSANLYRDIDINKEDLSTQYFIDILNHSWLSLDQLFVLFDYAKSLGLGVICTPFDIRSANLLNGYGLEIFKVASCDLTNHPLLRHLVSLNRRIICSTGMSNEEDIIEACNILKNSNYNLLHCNSTYPTPYKDINLNYLYRLKTLSKKDVGYSGHERGIEVSIAAVAMGATIIEKHITLTPEGRGNDHRVSLLPSEFKKMVECIRNIEDSLGTQNPRIISTGEVINRSGLAKSLIATREIQIGENITSDLIDIKSPGGGLQPNKIHKLTGIKAKRTIPKYGFFFESDLKEDHIQTRFKFNHKWGFPVRFHDYKHLLEISNPDFIEFHLTYNDLLVNIDECLGEHDIDITVHAPDVFDTILMDLGSLSPSTAKESIGFLSQTVKVAQRIRKHFKTKRTKLIVSSGCCTHDEWIKESSKKKFYKQIAEAIKPFQSDEIEIIMQTLPPFPWYFGGQYRLNLFTKPNEIKEFCEEYNTRICFDTSHSQLACNYHKGRLDSYIWFIEPYVAHMHLSDAIGVDDEGTQIGFGDVDFNMVSTINASFIPEIWRGHENNYIKMWEGLTKLQEWF